MSAWFSSSVLLTSTSLPILFLTFCEFIGLPYLFTKVNNPKFLVASSNQVIWSSKSFDSNAQSFFHKKVGCVFAICSGVNSGICGGPVETSSSVVSSASFSDPPAEDSVSLSFSFAFAFDLSLFFDFSLALAWLLEFDLSADFYPEETCKNDAGSPSFLSAAAAAASSFSSFATASPPFVPALSPPDPSPGLSGNYL